MHNHRNGRTDRAPIVAGKVINPAIIEKERSADQQADSHAVTANETEFTPVVDWAERRMAPSVNVLDPTKSSGVEYKRPSQAMGQLEVMQALGTASPEYFESIMAQLKRVSWRDGLISDAALNFLLGVITDFKPTNHVEVMLAAQIATVHLTAMRFAPELMTAQTPEEIELFERAVTRLFRTSAMLVDSYTRRKVAERNDRPAASPRNRPRSLQTRGRIDRDSPHEPEQTTPGNGAHAPVKTAPENRAQRKSNRSGASHNPQRSARMAARPHSH